MDLTSFLDRFSGSFIDDKRLIKIYNRTTFFSNGCWENSCTPKSRYPTIRSDGKIRRLNRVMLYLEHNLSFEDLLQNNPEKQALHRCNNTRCIRPDHMYLGSVFNNIVDIVKDKNLYFQKIDYATAVNIRFELMMGKSDKGTANKYKLSRSHVCRIRNNKTWIPKNYVQTNHCKMSNYGTGCEEA